MAKKGKDSGFSFSTFVTFIGGIVLLVAWALPLYHVDAEYKAAIWQSAQLAEALRTQDANVDVALQERLLLQDPAYIGERDVSAQRLGDPVRDIVSQFSLDLEPAQVVPAFSQEMVARADRAAANPTAWNLYRVAEQTWISPDTFTSDARQRGLLAGGVLMVLPFLGVMCLAMPFLSGFRLQNPIFQAITFAALLAVAAAAFLVVQPTPTAVNSTLAIGVPGDTLDFGMLGLWAALLPLGVAVLVGLFHRLWWVSLALYVLVVILAVVGYFVVTSNAPAESPAVLLHPAATATLV